MSTTALTGVKAQQTAEELEKLYAEFFTPLPQAAKPQASAAHFVEASFYDYSIITVVDESSAS